MALGAACGSVFVLEPPVLVLYGRISHDGFWWPPLAWRVELTLGFVAGAGLVTLGPIPAPHDAPAGPRSVLTSLSRALLSQPRPSPGETFRHRAVEPSAALGGLHFSPFGGGWVCCHPTRGDRSRPGSRANRAQFRLRQ